MVKSLSHISGILVSDTIDITHLNNILPLVTALVKHWCWKYHLGVALKNKLKSPVSDATYLFGVFTEKWQLSWIGTSRSFSPYGVRLGLLHVRDCKGGLLATFNHFSRVEVILSLFSSIFLQLISDSIKIYKNCGIVSRILRTAPSWGVSENFLLTNEPFAKALRIIKSCLLININL